MRCQGAFTLTEHKAVRTIDKCRLATDNGRASMKAISDGPR